MAHSLDPADFILPTVEDFISGDSRILAFTVENDAGTIDISGSTVEWRLFRREYETGDGDAILTGSDSGVEIVTDSRVDTTEGEFEVRLDPAATADLWGQYFHRPRVEKPNDGTEASWLGELVITA